MIRDRFIPALGLIVLAVLVISGIAPHDRLTWLLETAPVMIAGAVLLTTYRPFPLTSLLYILIAAHAFVLILCGAYTYARVPIGFWLQSLFGLTRNPYDKIGHFMQGLVPMLAAREILLRRRFVFNLPMAGFLSVCVAMAVSAVYELIEWWAALILGQGANRFLGTQGDPWDTQSDMFLAMIGAMAALLALSRLHDRQIAAITESLTTDGEKKAYFL